MELLTPIHLHGAGPFHHRVHPLQGRRDPNAGHRIQREDHDGLENLAQYIIRNPFSLEKMTYYPETGQVIYRSKRNHKTKRLWETDPFICPNCGHLMRVTGILEDPDDAANLLQALG